MNEANEALHTIVEAALKEDVGDGDHTTLSCIPADAKGRALLKIKEDGVIAGIEVARQIFTWKEPSSGFTVLKKDAEEVKAGEIAFEVNASVHVILKCERLVLNCMQRMSGIATLTRQYCSKLRGYKTKILDTRKTTPNFRLLEKEAVRIGGANNHRFGLYDMILLKDNHIDYCGGIQPAIERAYIYSQGVKPGLRIEVEARNVHDVREIVRVGKNKVFRIMLDNFKPSQLPEALEIINGEFETEASGGINLDNVEAYAQTGVDYVSVGGLIHQAKSMDLSLKAVIL